MRPKYLSPLLIRFSTSFLSLYFSVHPLEKIVDNSHHLFGINSKNYYTLSWENHGKKIHHLFCTISIYSKLPTRQLTLRLQVLFQLQISKLPTRQLTYRRSPIVPYFISKLPTRQLTCLLTLNVLLLISKLPTRQLTCIPNWLHSSQISKLPTRQLTMGMNRLVLSIFSKLPTRQLTRQHQTL